MQSLASRSLPLPRQATPWASQLPSNLLFAPSLNDIERPCAIDRNTTTVVTAPRRRRTSVLVFLERVLCLT